MMTITGSIRLAIHVGQGLRMAKVAGSAQRKVKGHWSLPVPIAGHLELSAHHEIREPLTPVSVWGERYPVTIIHFEADRRRLRRAREFPIAKGRERLMASIDQRLNERKSLSDLE